MNGRRAREKPGHSTCPDCILCLESFEKEKNEKEDVEVLFPSTIPILQGILKQNMLLPKIFGNGFTDVL